jgi:hypothetical protein
MNRHWFHFELKDKYLDGPYYLFVEEILFNSNCSYSDKPLAISNLAFLKYYGIHLKI